MKSIFHLMYTGQGTSQVPGSLIDRMLNILFPESCPICDNPADAHETAPICRQCWQSIRPYRGPVCRTCGKPLFSDAAERCGDCMKKRPSYRSARFFGLYDGTLRKAINLFKYHRIRRLSHPLCTLLMEIEIPPVQVVVPVPLHGRRLREREFNQSALLARGMAQRISAHFALHCLARSRYTGPQVGLRYGKRRSNVRKAFEAAGGSPVAGRSVLLVDDVITTGATMQECSAVLKKAGAREVHVIALARGMRD